MNHQVNAIAGRLSLRPPQRRSLEILDRITEIVPPRKGADIAAALAAIRSEFPTVTDFEREFPSVCFALATGVGKTRLMGAFISYLHLAHGINNFFVMAPNLTIYNKLITDFTPNTPKYVFKGIAEFATDAPEIITGDDYEAKACTLFDQLLRCKVNIFNISKINSEVRGGKSPRIKRLSEYIGESYFEYLAGLPDLVLIMDESHRYRASAGVRAINELKPVIGLELTATPFVETAKGAAPFKNVILDYPLGKAMADGFVKEPAVVTRKNFNPAGMPPEAVELMKLQDGVRLHEQVKVELETYARESGNAIVKPFVLVIARDTTHAKQLIDLIQSDAFFEGRYRQPPADKSNMAKYLFGGFKRCLYSVQKFQADPERKLSVILEREASRWFKPAKGQFQIYYKSGADHLEYEYQPDFVAETEATIYMLEPKRRDEMTDPDVVAKKEAAVTWCQQASGHAKTYHGKPWKYLLIPHDIVADNITLEWLASQFAPK